MDAREGIIFSQLLKVERSKLAKLQFDIYDAFSDRFNGASK